MKTASHSLMLAMSHSLYRCWHNSQRDTDKGTGDGPLGQCYRKRRLVQLCQSHGNWIEM